jgi:hypothetical protein
MMATSRSAFRSFWTRDLDSATSTSRWSAGCRARRVRTSAGSQVPATTPTTPRRKVPVSEEGSEMRSRSCSIAPTTWLDIANSSRPLAVSCARCALRSNSSTPK